MNQQELVATLDAVTPGVVESGLRVFQVHRFGRGDLGHVSRLLDWAEIAAEARVVDMGCGIGEVARLADELGYFDIDWTLVNLSPVQLSYCGERHTKLLRDFEDTGLPAGQYDMVMFCFAIGHGSHSKAMQEAARLLRPGGVLFIYDMVRVSGGNERIREACYEVHGREFMDLTASAAGFDLDWYMEPNGSSKDVFRIIGGTDIFDGTKAAIWRFVKR